MAAKGAVITGSVSLFSGPDDLLLDPASNVIAVDIGGDTTGNVVNGVSFLNDGTGITGSVSNGGVMVSSTATHSINGWSGAPSYSGGTPGSAAALGNIMHDIRWSLNPANVSVDITGLSDGTLYNVQLLFSENGSAADRHPLPGDPNNTGAVGGDNNPVLHAVIVHEVIPEPGSLALLGLGLSTFFLRRRRN